MIYCNDNQTKKGGISMGELSKEYLENRENMITLLVEVGKQIGVSEDEIRTRILNSEKKVIES